MIQIEVTAEVIPGSGKMPAKQVVYVHTIGKDGKKRLHPERTTIALWDNQEALPAGPNYTLDPSSVYVGGKYGEMLLAPKLRQIPAGRGGAA
jgi:hypothetical protein